MKKQILSLAALCLILSCNYSKNTTLKQNNKEKANPEKYAVSITQEELKEMLYTYASDEFEGRETGEKGQKMAVEYLKKQYQALGIPSPLGGQNYFQKVPLEKQQVAQADVTVNGTSFSSFEDHIVLRVTDNMAISTKDIVFVGYGIDSDNYSDYKNSNVEGKIVLAKAGEPKDANGNYVTTGKTEATKWTNGRQSLSSKRSAAIENGAKGLIFISNDLFNIYAPYYQRIFESGKPGSLSLKGNSKDFFMLMGNTKLGKALHAEIDTDQTTKNITTQLELNIENKADAITSENVVAFIKGEEKPDEILVVSAHLDHIGVQEDGQINNGADDDGSGTIALLEIAEAFKMAQKDGFGPKRSILFLHVTGEEKGLLGSRHYTDNDPVFPLENTVANLNIDMIGRIDPKREKGERNYIYLIGSDKLSTDLHTISEMVNKTYCNVELDYTYNDDNDPNRFYYRSDHYNFAKNNIPIIFYFNGTHDDYHKPSDTPDKIEYDLLENRTRLVFHTAWEVANREERVVVDKAEK